MPKRILSEAGCANLCHVARPHDPENIAMSDELSFPALATSALTQAFTFLYGRLAVVLDRKLSSSERKEIEKSADSSSVEATSLKVDKSTLTKERMNILKTLDDALAVYKDNPELIRPENEQLLRSLGRLREELETVHNHKFFFGEEHASTSRTVVEQKVDRVSGEVIGLEADEIQGEASAHVSQVSQNVESGAKMIGAKFRRME